MKSISTKENAEKLKEIRNALLEDGKVRVVNLYETFHGCGFDGWLKKGLQDLDVTYEVICRNHFADCGYPWVYEITLNQDPSKAAAESLIQMLKDAINGSNDVNEVNIND